MSKNQGKVIMVESNVVAVQGVRRKAKVSHSKTSKAEALDEDMVVHHLVFCGIAKIIWYVTALIGRRQGRFSKRPKSKEIDFLNPRPISCGIQEK